MKPIFDDKGRMIDVSDEGEQARQIESEIDAELTKKRLFNKTERKVIDMRMTGETDERIAKKLKMSLRTVERTFERIRKKWRDDVSFMV